MPSVASDETANSTGVDVPINAASTPRIYTRLTDTTLGSFLSVIQTVSPRLPGTPSGKTSASGNKLLVSALPFLAGVAGKHGCQVAREGPERE